MTDQRQREVFDAICNARGGAASLNAAQVEIAVAISSLLASPPSDPAAMVRSADAVERLMARLPPETEKHQADLTKLTAAQFDQLDHLLKIARGEIENAPLPEAIERVPGHAEIEGQLIGRWIDEHHGRWRFRALLTLERNHLRNGFQAMARGFIARNLWLDIYRDLQGKAIDAVPPAANVGFPETRVAPEALDGQVLPPERPLLTITPPPPRAPDISGPPINGYKRFDHPGV